MARHGKEMIALEERPGEGTPLPVTRQVLPNDVVRLSYNLAGAPVPDRRYTADTATVLRQSENVCLLLAQRNFLNRELRSVVAITISPEAVHRFLESSGSVLDTMRGYAKKAKLSSPDLSALEHEPSQVVVLSSNVISLAFAAREACFDFYNSSPWAMREAFSKNHVQVDPVLRVHLPTALAHAILEKLHSLRDDLPVEDSK